MQNSSREEVWESVKWEELWNFVDLATKDRVEVGAIPKFLSLNRLLHLLAPTVMHMAATLTVA